MKLIVTAGGTQITFGASVWLVVITIAMVYAMPARTIVNVSEKENVDISMLASRGRGSLDLLLMGSVAEKVVRDSRTPVFLMPVRDRKDGKIAIYASEY